MRLYLAGAEAWGDLLISMAVKNQLYSYFYFRSALRGKDGGKAKTLLKRMERAKAKGYSFMLDSGAFTYQSKTGKVALPPPDAYMREYVQFCKDWGHLFDIIAELDIDGCVMPDGQTVAIEQIDGWTTLLIEALGKDGYKVMPVYHGNSRSMQWLQRSLVDVRTGYIGFSSDTVDGASAMIAMAHRYGKFVHGFGQTGINTSLKTVKFDSVDSTTWLRADKYGGTNIFRNNKWIVLDHLHKHQRALYRDWYESWGLDFKKIMTEDLHELRQANIVAWRELGNSFEQKAMFLNRGKQPYLLDMHLKGQPPKEHPVITNYKRQQAAQSSDD